MSKSKTQYYYLEAREPKFKKEFIKKKFKQKNYLKSIKSYEDAISDNYIEEKDIPLEEE